MAKFLRLTLPVGALLFFSLTCFGQRSGRLSDKVYPLTSEDAAQRWYEFLHSSMPSDYCFKLELEHRPRKGEAVIYDGMMWGTAGSAKSYAIRLSVKKREADASAATFLMLSNAGRGEIYKEINGKTEKLHSEQWQEPLLEGLIYTPFDALMPYKYWPWSYTGPGRVGRALHFFSLTAPDDFIKNAPLFSKIRVGLSREFNAPFQTEYFDGSGSLLRTLSLSSIKKFQGNWVSKEIEMLENETRNKDRITLVEGAFVPSIDSSVFNPKKLDIPASVPQLEKL